MGKGTWDFVSIHICFSTSKFNPNKSTLWKNNRTKEQMRVYLYSCRLFESNFETPIINAKIFKLSFGIFKLIKVKLS